MTGKTRRAVLKGAAASGAAVAIGAAVTALPSGAIASANPAFAAAEKEILRLLRKFDASESDTETDAIWEEYTVLEDFIIETAPETLEDAAVKLRRILDPKVGLPIGESESDLPGLQQVLAVVERVAAGGAS